MFLADSGLSSRTSARFSRWSVIILTSALMSSIRLLIPRWIVSECSLASSTRFPRTLHKNAATPRADAHNATKDGERLYPGLTHSFDPPANRSWRLLFPKCSFTRSSTRLTRSSASSLLRSSAVTENPLGAHLSSGRHIEKEILPYSILSFKSVPVEIQILQGYPPQSLQFLLPSFEIQVHANVIVAEPLALNLHGNFPLSSSRGLRSSRLVRRSCKSTKCRTLVKARASTNSSGALQPGRLYGRTLTTTKAMPVAILAAATIPPKTPPNTHALVAKCCERSSRRLIRASHSRDFWNSHPEGH